ncbi:2-isopropylmalate synthase [Marinobacter sp. 2_MG-2023]|uniref:2-isopropylmalate synthase n=1 Tax=Marinobacter sp. 2_MG-2023 TaxID=3062679 RepID=UPI0026E41FE8|nr:2-isopropylmalate synthase [Marinobacter sp. 2_MG-2023]MDO6441273.1 2-isopropylmalate synthase [Marinobacter sp. 2_MG-2023]
MIQTEAQRQFYLGVAGIRLWYAREPLPGAAPSPELEFADPGEPEQAPIPGHTMAARKPGGPGTPNPAPALSGSNQRGGQRIASLQALMEKSAGVSEKELPAAEVPVDEALSSSDSHDSATSETRPKVPEDKTFKLNLAVFSGEHHLLVAGISKEASLRLQEILAANILKSLGEEKSRLVEWVQWPVFNNTLVAGGSTANLMAVLQHVFRDAGGKKVVVLGNIDGADAVQGGAGGWLSEALERCPDIECEYSLAELASNPGAKRSLWQQLRPLVSA